MSDLLTHWAVFEDARRLAARDSEVCAEFSAALETETDIARLGALTRGGNRWAPALLARYRPAAAEPAAEPANVRRKLAFALGGIAHYAADVLMKPLMSRVAEADWHAAHAAMQRAGAGGPRAEVKVSIREVSAYYDCHVFRAVYGDGAEPPFAPERFLLAENKGEAARALESFARALFQRALLSCHTLAPPKDDAEPWLDRLFALLQPLYVSLDLYARVYAAPDPAKMALYEVETSFYRADDPAVRAARRAQHGEPLASADLDAALAEGANRGAYGQAVALALRRLREASAYWLGKTENPPDVRQ